MKTLFKKENQLFPIFRKIWLTSPSQGMWAFHDQIRAEIKVVRKAIEEKDLDNILNDLIVVFNSLSQLMLVEENRLCQNAMNLLNEEDWKEMYEGDCEIGWMFSTPPAQYPPKAQEEYVHPSLDTKKKENYLFN